MSEEWQVFWLLAGATAVSWLVIYCLYGNKNKGGR